MDWRSRIRGGCLTGRRSRDGSSGVRNSVVPVVALSAHIDPACRALCREVGMDDFIEKPINQQRLVAVLQRWFQLNLL